MLEMSPTGLKTCLDTLLHIVEDLQQGGRCNSPAESGQEKEQAKFHGDYAIARDVLQKLE
jgi:hypothetical protein